MEDYSDEDMFDEDFHVDLHTDSEDEPQLVKKRKSTIGQNGESSRAARSKLEESVNSSMPRPIKLRKFLEESVEVLDVLDNSLEMQEMRELHSSLRTTKTNSLTAATRSGRHNTSQITVNSLVLNGFEVYQDEEKLLRQQHMHDIRRRIEASAVSFRDSHSFSMAQHIHAAPGLKTLQSRKATMDHVEISHANEVDYRRSLYSYPIAKELAFQAANKQATEGGTIPRELVINVWVSRGRNPKTNRDRNILQQLMLNCLGSQTLCDIASHIQCSTEPTLSGEVLAEPEVAALKDDQFFFIESTFYSTQMDKMENRAGYYQSMLQTPEFSSILGKETTVESIDSVCLMDVEMSLGKAYVYNHGVTGCEHFVVFSDARLLHPLDELDLSKYPRVLYQSRKFHASCFICKKSARNRITGSKRFPYPVTNLCHNCHNSFNLNDNGLLIEGTLEVSVIPGKTADVMDADEEDLSEVDNESEVDEDEID